MDLEALHEMGYLPTRYYNQMNKKSTQENYKRQRLKIGKKKKNEDFIQMMLRQFLYQTMKELLKELLPKEIKL